MGYFSYNSKVSNFARILKVWIMEGLTGEMEEPCTSKYLSKMLYAMLSIGIKVKVQIYHALTYKRFHHDKILDKNFN